MVDGQVRTNKVTDHKLIHLLRQIPREQFVDGALQSVAYIDEDIVLPSGRFLIEPMVLARLIQAAEIQSTDRVLDVGCTTGYSTAILAPLCQTVIGIDVDAALVQRAEMTCKNMDIVNAAFSSGPMLNGYGPTAPYDVILVNGALPELPYKLFDQLRDGGRLLCVLRTPSLSGSNIVLGIGKAMLYKKTDSAISGRVLFDAATPYLEKPDTQNKFIF